MPVIRCENCEKYIDLDWDVDHESECNEPQEINDIHGKPINFDEVEF